MLILSLADLKQSIASWRLWTLLGWLEIRQRYARSRLGPFWLTISMGVMISSLGVVYGTLFGQKLSEYLPYLASSIVLWGLFSQTVQDGSVAYINSSSYIRQMATPKLIYILQVVWRNLIVLVHNFVIIVALLLIFGVKNWETLPMFIPGLFLFILNALWIAMVAGLLSARFRDLPQIIGALLQVAFYVTPIIFRPDALTRFAFIVEWNPLAYLIDVVRGPLIGHMPSALTWGVVIGMAAIGWPLALLLTGRFLKRIPYWV
ncbi:MULTISPECIES: ABC transporter permease [Burkholderia]|uniref:ABC transporter permease n=1 Tax=Burkholderia cepacia TaxID=292 RepID=UPI000758A748|nr:ABC transporter permease [Burkholderia cepacia]KVS27246.1 ABC transporter permease [Burkholderia cepacia]MCA7902471.1 ABC transporter permease [Burkholderia cepacia]MCA8123325.1 ABC transporter permease [Burkholderia cepacia]MDN7440420.1 ABC transporter permease [Burkholderia cepacia]MDW9243936.1 ABC-2 type transporter family protein [Burkholderia cepacia]